MPSTNLSNAYLIDADDLYIERGSSLPLVTRAASPAEEEARRLEFDSDGFDKLTHYLFRYPAKFHPPVARTLIERYSERGDLVLDPFCGSGTILVEAAATGRHAMGTDIDPVAVFTSRIKTHRYNIGHLRTSSYRLFEELVPLERSNSEYNERQFCDLSEGDMWDTVRDELLWVPAIPNLLHWFRRYVVVDLARILRVVRESRLPHTQVEFFLLCFASIIRAASNADPVPVSGLEYTSHMRQRDEEGRLINPFRLFFRAVELGIDALEGYRENTSPEIKLTARHLDVLRLSGRLGSVQPAVVITSPPYHSAVDYYRRHQLEMFWLGMTTTQRERAAIKHDYIGRPKVRVSEPLVEAGFELPALAAEWHGKMVAKSPKRALAFRHYSVAMHKAAHQIGRVIQPGARAIFVVGHSTWDDQELPTTDLFLELMQDDFDAEEVLWYPLKNRYMSYDRHNGASIDKEHVLVLRRK